MDNTARFEGKAALYRQYRPSYPKEYFDYLWGKAGLCPGDAVADIGAGTGIFSEQLLELGLRVFAVEPGADMRGACQAQLGQNPAFSAIAGTAERTGLAPGSMKLVTAAQAFHWFDKKAFGAECRRILQPGGLVALIWNSRDLDSALTGKCRQAFRAYCPGFTEFSGGVSLDPDDISSFFLDGRMGYRRFKNDVYYDCDAFLGRMLSSSYAPKKGEAHYEDLVLALRQVFAEESRDGRLLFPMQTTSFLGQPA